LIPITDEEFGAHARVRSATITDPFVFLVLENGRVALYETDAKSKDIDVHSNMSLIQVCYLVKLVLKDRANLLVALYFKDEVLIFCPEK